MAVRVPGEGEVYNIPRRDNESRRDVNRRLKGIRVELGRAGERIAEACYKRPRQEAAVAAATSERSPNTPASDAPGAKTK